MARVYQPELGQNIQQGFANMGSLFAPPSPQEMVARQSIAGQQATQAAQSTARTNIAGGKGTPADYAALGIAEPVKNYIMGKQFADSQAHPDASPASFDSGVYISGGDASKTFTGQQAAPLNVNQSRILPPSLAGGLKMPANQRGVLDLGDDNKATDFAAYRNDQRKAGRPVSFNDFDSAWQQQHARENIFQPIIDKFNAGGFSPPGALPPQPGGGMPPTRQSSVATGPGGGQPPTAPAPVGQQSPIAQARAAIAAGAPRDKVLQRLQQQGIDFSGQAL